MGIKINFSERTILRAPLEVLEHLYFYTTQYGMSVKQFTGRHWKYWEKLPSRLEDAKNNQAQLDRLTEELIQLARDSDKRRKRRQAQKNKKWAQKEVILNAQLLSVLGTLPESLIASSFNRLVGATEFPSHLKIVDLSMKGDDGEHVNFLEPDLLLLGEDHLVMVEIKTRGSPRSSRDYPPKQLLNYLQLVAECRQSNSPGLPKIFTHIILVPTVESEWLENSDEWVVEMLGGDGRMKLDADACVRLAGTRSSYNYDVLRQLVREVPIFYRSWDQMYTAFDKTIQHSIESPHYAHFRKIVDEIGVLSQRAGKFA